MLDPMESAFEKMCCDNGIEFRRDDQTKDGSQLDFYLPKYDVYVEVKQFHTNRISEQMSRRHNVIAIQGMGSLNALRELLN